GPGCAPKSCVQLGAECGQVPDGCGGAVDCGTCAAGQHCGGGGPNRCGTSQCTPKTCTQLNASCGVMSDGCGEVLSCGTCVPPEFCGGGGVDNQCGCTPATCASVGAECGLANDGCGELLDCGSCPSDEICGGDQANRCSDKPCTPTTCQAIGASCGTHPDGCDGVLQCGGCVAPETCGGGGNPKACGCTPTSCAAEGAECGALPDGCGVTLQCGSCPYGSCQSHECVCTPDTCAGAGADCGTISDGCGNTLDCGTCVAPKGCGASGTPNVCGCNPTICPPFYVNSFEPGTDFPDAWTFWHNCAQDADWFVQQSPYPAPSGGTKNLRFRTTTFLSSCDWPGAYAQTPALNAQAGRTYRVESWSRHASSTAGMSLLFFDANDEVLSQHPVQWPPDSWQYQENPATSGVAPQGTSYLKVRIRLVTPDAHLDFDRLAVYLEP
ncbi:MAG: hypothetical protein ACOC1F_02740, partial [Myxococcota bacterium]